MALNIDYEFISELTIIINAGEKKFIKFNGIPSISMLSIHLMDITGSCIVKSAQESDYFINHKDTAEGDLLWELLKINGVPQSSITSNILSLTFRSPSILCVENISTTERVKVSIRGNR